MGLRVWIWVSRPSGKPLGRFWMMSLRSFLLFFVVFAQVLRASSQLYDCFDLYCLTRLGPRPMARGVERSTIAGAWNRERLRFGDKVADADQASSSRKPHANLYDPRLVLKNAWRQIGMSKTVRCGIDGVSRELGVLSVVSSLLEQRQAAFLSGQLAGISGCPVWSLFYDTTPVRLGFGRAQDSAVPNARYSVKDNTGAYKLVPYREYMRLNPRRPVPRYGVLEVFAQGTTCHFLNAACELEGFRVFCMPRALSSNNASVLLRATETALPAFSRAGLAEMASKHKFSCVAEALREFTKRFCRLCFFSLPFRSCHSQMTCMPSSRSH